MSFAAAAASSHHMEIMEAGLEGLYIRAITSRYQILIQLHIILYY